MYFGNFGDFGDMWVPGPSLSVTYYYSMLSTTVTLAATEPRSTPLRYAAPLR